MTVPVPINSQKYTLIVFNFLSFFLPVFVVCFFFFKKKSSWDCCYSAKNSLLNEISPRATPRTKNNFPFTATGP